ncbi:MAG: pilus assembly protein, partial [Burkholderiaceae bacterium]
MAWRGFRARLIPLLKAGGMTIILSAAGQTHAGIPEVDLATSPLTGSANVHPNVLLSFSIDESASRAAYLDGHEHYDRARDYAGYFNPRKCYAYQGGNRNISSGYFYILRDADALRECSQSFSGNFMNWASTSLLDILRYALTGGDRVVDTVQATVLQRAVLKDASYAEAGYFPRKTLQAGANSSIPNRVTPFNVNVLYIVSCRDRILFSDVRGTGNDCNTSAYDGNGKLAAGDKKLGEYLARVQVCDRHEGSTRTDLCQAYGKIYKPVGVLQRYAEELRYSVMGYLLDPTEKRYGGVLRSSMAYIGQLDFPYPGFSATANQKPEWDAATGILYSSPGTNTAVQQNTAGTINYINRFGRSGSYKKFDPISELYYEGLRYLQGKPPTSAAMEDMPEAMKDGLPVVTPNSDPVIAACQKNYLLSIGDANTHWDRYLPGNQRTTLHGGQHAHDQARPVEPAAFGKTPSLDVKPWTEKVGEMEADVGGRHGNPSPRGTLANLHMLDTGSDGHGSYYMAGLAYWANTQDIRHDKPIRVRTLTVDLDEGGNGNLDGGTRAVKPQDSQLFLAAKYGGFRDVNKNGNPFATYADDGKALVRLDTEEWDSAGSGSPDAYLIAGDPRALIDGVRSMFAMLVDEGTDDFYEHVRHGVLVPPDETGKADATLYQAGFSRIRWRGSLKKFRVRVTADGDAERSAMPVWDAGKILTGTRDTPPLPSPDERKIFTYGTHPGKQQSTVEFRWQALDAMQRTSLSTTSGDARDEDLGEMRLNYLRGDRTRELGRRDGIFRVRRTILGDIVNSIPVYAGPPDATHQDIDYPAFQAQYRQRTKAVYVGANDGMLHAFDADSGVELFAYVPNALMPSLALLTQPEYRHRPFVDGGIAVGDAKVQGKWRTVLAAGMGAGAQGVFALDVSDPAHFDRGLGAIWEFTDRDDPDIGHVMAAPQIAKFRTKMAGGLASYEYFIVVPSGINHYKADGAGTFSSTGQPVLFLLSLQKEPSSAWKLGVNYYKIRLPAGETNAPQALSQPVLAGDAAGAVRHAYAGDIQGNLWRFDFKDGAPWSKALGSNAKPLFTARDQDGGRQPITTQPRLVYAPGKSYMVLFGTGKFLEAQDAAPAGFGTQS